MDLGYVASPAVPKQVSVPASETATSPQQCQSSLEQANLGSSSVEPEPHTQQGDISA